MNLILSNLINYLKKNKSSEVSLIISIILWLLLFLILIFVPLKQTQKYNEIQIILDSPNKEIDSDNKNFIEKYGNYDYIEKKQSEETQKSKPVDNEKAVSENTVQDENKIIQKVDTQNKITKKDESIIPSKDLTEEKIEKASTKNEAPVYEIQKSTEDLINEQMNRKKESSAIWDDSLFSDEQTKESNSSKENTEVVKAESSFSGTAGNVSESEDKGAKSSSSDEKKQTNVTSGVSDALSSIKSTSYSSSTDGVQSNSLVDSYNSNSGGTNIKMMDGSVRTLISSKEPYITISSENAKLIGNTVTVTISFTILESGNIPLGEIKITPVSLLSSSIRTEVSEQISRWIFEPANYISKGSFEYTVIKK